MKSPLVSFIIPYYNSGSTIQETIDSINNQSYKNFDIWLVDDGSTDAASVNKLIQFENHPQIHLLRQENAGPSVARNLAIKQTKAKIIIPLDADDKITYDCIEKTLPALLENEKTGVVYGNHQYFGDENYLKIQALFDIKKQLLFNLVAVCCLIKKEVFETAGYYDEFLSKPGLEDWEFWIRVYEHGWKIKKIEHTLFELRVNNNSRTFQVANKNVEMIKSYVYKKHLALLARNYEALYYELKVLKETTEVKIGVLLLKPYRFIKKVFQIKR